MRKWYLYPAVVATTLGAGCSDSIVDNYPFPEGKVSFTHAPLDGEYQGLFLKYGRQFAQNRHVPSVRDDP